MIVERPERILASVLGISAAYVRLGERHTEGGNPPHPLRNPSQNIPFKIRKTSRSVNITSSVVTNVHGTKWMEELKIMCDSAERKLAATGKELSRLEGHNVPGQPAKEKLHEGDLYLCPESLNAFQGALGGVLDAVDTVFQGTKTATGPSRAFVCIRPPGHHCSADFPSGFCWLNNVHVGIEHAAMAHGLTHAAIIDFDLHHGDGSQSITWAHNSKVAKMPKNTPNSKKTSIGYFSLHDINSYPCEWGDDEKVQNASLCIENAHGQSIWNVHLQPWKTEAEFWALYESRYIVLIEKARAYLKQHTVRLSTSPNQPPPKAAIFLSAGFDASEWESQGMQRHKVNVPTEFYARFTRDVVRLAQEEGTAVEGRIISVLEGGYSDRALISGVLSHLSGLCDGQISTSQNVPAEENGLGYEMGQRLGAFKLKDEDVPVPTTETTYDPAWWHESRLAELENLVNPPPLVAPKKPRTGAPPTYYSSTQSFSAKVVDPTRVHRSVSSSGKLMSASPSRAPTPPPPEVDWATASYELSKLLIPTDRQTKSCTPEELAESRVKKERQSIAPATLAVEPPTRQLRGRKAKSPTYAEPESEEDKSSAVSRSSRRQTIADFPLVTTESASRTASRRMSVSSSIGSINGDRVTSRAPSAIPSRTSSVTPAASTVANGIQARKARAPTQPHVEAIKPRMTKIEPPVPRAPSGNTNKAPRNKENDVDQLTLGLQRITLKLPPKEEYEARERQKALDAETKKAATKATRKTAARTTKTTTTRKPAIKETKVASLPSPVESSAGPASIDTDMTFAQPEAPKAVGAASEASLVQPQPVQPLPPSITHSSLPTTIQRPASDSIITPTCLVQMEIEPDQLPKAHFTTVESLPMTTSPSRPDTPPPPQFIHYNPPGTDKALLPPPHSHSTTSYAPLQWLPPNSELSLPGPPMSPGIKQRTDLPVFTANGIIPFAPNPDEASVQPLQKFDQVFPGNSETSKGVEVRKEDLKDI